VNNLSPVTTDTGNNFVAGDNDTGDSFGGLRGF
jgi:hypothetical protein